MNVTFMQKIELRFWDITLPLMTRSQAVRKIIQTAVSVYHNDALVKKIAVIGMIGCAGFSRSRAFWGKRGVSNRDPRQRASLSFFFEKRIEITGSLDTSKKHKMVK